MIMEYDERERRKGTGDDEPEPVQRLWSTDAEIRDELVRRIKASKHFYLHTLGGGEEIYISDLFVFHIKMRGGDVEYQEGVSGDDTITHRIIDVTGVEEEQDIEGEG
jgi:hypothetical protein